MVREAWRKALLTEFDGLVLVTKSGETWIGVGFLADAVKYLREKQLAIWGMEGFRTDGLHAIATAYVVDWDEEGDFANLPWQALCERTAEIALNHCRQWAESGDVEFVEFNVASRPTS